MENSDEEYEYEEVVVLVELNGIIDPNFLLQEQTPIKILGVETDEPVLQLGHYIFSGEYEDTLGTVIAYEPVKTTNSEGKDIENYKLLCKTDKKLSMKRVFLEERENTSVDESSLLNNENAAVADCAMDCTDAYADSVVNKE